MSIEENKALTSRWYDEFWNKRKFEVADELMADNLVDHHLPPGTPTWT
jgi:hypothetical protein